MIDPIRSLALPTSRWATLLLALVAAGCLSPSDTPPVQYFTPPLPLVQPAQTDGAPTARLRQAEHAAYLGERMVWRTDGVQSGFYEYFRWAPTPAEIVYEALQAAMFDSGRMQRSAQPGVASVALEVQDFSQVLSPRTEARVRLRVIVVDGAGLALSHRTYKASRPLTDREPLTLSREMATLVADLADDVTRDVVALLRSQPAAP